jgi:fido (protein-threonine AMPylation protein)
LSSGPAWEHLAFFDAYFSNYIEGTEFQVDEAAEIVFQNRIPTSRPQDAHEVLGTYLLVSSRQEMTESALATAMDFERFLALLKRRHRMIMQARPDKRPGEFKEEGNRAGATFFVAPALVRGTLRKGLELFRGLPHPFQRAAFMMFLVAEVHPFDDGNGRVARVMMNAELISGGERRILIPTVYRPDYLATLKALTLTDRTAPFIRMLDRAQAFTAQIDFHDFGQARRRLENARAFETSEDAILRD